MSRCIETYKCFICGHRGTWMGVKLPCCNVYTHWECLQKHLLEYSKECPQCPCYHDLPVPVQWFINLDWDHKLATQLEQNTTTVEDSSPNDYASDQIIIDLTSDCDGDNQDFGEAQTNEIIVQPAVTPSTSKQAKMSRFLECNYQIDAAPGEEGSLGNSSEEDLGDYGVRHGSDEEEVINEEDDTVSEAVMDVSEDEILERGDDSEAEQDYYKQ